jgi:RHS repeat-associated protein
VGAGTVVNDCHLVYNDFGQLVTEFQSHNGPVEIESTPKVSYVYLDGSMNTTRQTQLIYPTGRSLTYSYGEVTDIDFACSRVAALIDDDGDTHLIEYSYLGLLTHVLGIRPEPEIEYTLVGTTGGDDPSTGDIYHGFDRFGRIKESCWYNYGMSSDVDRLQYGYNLASNRTWRKNVVASSNGRAFDEYYDYDDVYRLTHLQRGVLNTGNTGLSAVTFAQCWQLDTTANWESFKQGSGAPGAWDLTQVRTSNQANEIASISTTTGPHWETPAYSPTGSLVRVPNPVDLTESCSLTFDAWERLVMIDNPVAALEVTYEYDGFNRRTFSALSDGDVREETADDYYTTARLWQVIERHIENESTVIQQLLWDGNDGDAPLLRDTYDGIELTARHYLTYDALRSVTAITDVSGSVIARYAYSGYGDPLILDADYDPLPSPPIRWDMLFASYIWIEIARLYLARNRVFSPLLGTWLQRDPIGYGADGNLYLYCYARPTTFYDPTGLAPPKKCAITMSESDGTPIFWDQEAGKFGGTTLSGICKAKQILDFVKKNKCCDIMLVGHRGGKENPGGIITTCSGTPGGTAVTTRILPDAELELDLAVSFLKNCKNGCTITISTCNDGAAIEKATRQVIANRTGCKVCGTTRMVKQGGEDSVIPTEHPITNKPQKKIELDCQSPNGSGTNEPVAPGGPRPPIVR